MKKATTFIILVVVMAVLLSGTALATESNEIASGECGENLTWVLTEDGVLTISGEGAMYDFELREPYYSDATAPWENDGWYIKTVVVDSGVTSIGDYAFFGRTRYSNLTQVVLPDTVVRIGDHAFHYCRKLGEITLPKSLETIGDCAFAASGNEMTEIEIPASVTYIGESAFAGWDLECIHLEAGNTAFKLIDGHLYSADGTVLMLTVALDGDEFIIPVGVKTIASNAFYCNTNKVRTVIFPEGLVNINNDAFVGCVYLTEVNLPSTVTNIGDFAFSGGNSLTKVTIPASVSFIGENAFEACGNLKTITFEHGIDDALAIEDDAFYYYSNLDTTIYVQDKNNIHSTISGYDWAEDRRTVTYLSTPAGEEIIDTFNGSPADVDANGNLLINETNFPDANFRDYIIETFDGEGIGYLTEVDVNAIEEIYCTSREIADLKGIEYFTSLTELDCQCNELTELDVTKNTALKILNCSENKLTELDVTKNTALIHLYCRYNKLTGLDVRKNTALINLTCSHNELAELDVSANTTLVYLECNDNALTELQVDRNTELVYLYCQYNDLTELDVSKNTALVFLYCHYNKLTELDVSKNTVLQQFECENNELTELDVSKNIALEFLGCDRNYLTTLDVSNNTALGSLFCRWNSLTALDVSKNTALTYLHCYGNTYKLTASIHNGQYVIDMKELVGEKNMTRVYDFVEGAYDDTTGIFTLDTPEDGEKTVIIYYTYNTGGKGSTSRLGVSLTVSLPEIESPDEPIITPGDLNGDGEINFIDVNRVIRYYRGLITLDEAQLAAADINGDGEINFIDVNRIIRYYRGLINSLS